MPTKPITTYTWDVNETNSAQPALTLRDDGYATNDIPTSGNFNYQLNSIYQWLDYFEQVTDALATLSSATDITLTVDSDNTSTSNAIIFKHNDPGVELARINEDANLILTDATSHTITMGNDALANANADGTFTISSQKHITMDIDSDNDGTDGIWKVRANGTTNALTVTEAGLVTATGDVIGTNITSDNLTAIRNNQISRVLGGILLYDFTSAAGTGADNPKQGRNTIGYRDSGGEAFATLDTADGILTAGLSVTFYAGMTINTQAGSFLDINRDNTYGVAVGSAGILYTASLTALGTWTSRTSGTANALGAVAGNNTWWVAVGSGANNTIRYNDSNPTDAWSGSTSGLDGTTTFKGLATNGTKFTAITSDDEVIYTTDPSVGWTLAGTVSGIGAMDYLEYLGSYWIAYDTGSTTYFYSTDGLSWSSTTVGAGLSSIQRTGVVQLAGTSTYLYLFFANGSIAYGTSITAINNTGSGFPTHATSGGAVNELWFESSTQRFLGRTAGLCYSGKVGV